jgi:hypothetical protein
LGTNSTFHISNYKINLNSRSLHSTGSDSIAADKTASNSDPSFSDIVKSDKDEIEVDFDALTAESAAQAFVPKSDLSSFYVKPETRKAPRQAKWFPMLLSPVALDGSFAGI